MVELSTAPPEASQDTASLVKRLAGPSVTKAGLAKDQTEINRIIAEVSKGSKFYENEKRKDKELTERITKILKIKDEVMKEADMRRVEMDADRLLEELESERDLSQTIVHIDMDAFYANVELLHNPDLAGKPFGVGKGVLSTASYEARKYGVRSGMAGFVAKKLCPGLILLPVNFEKYSEMSRKVMAIFKQHDPTMIVAGCDEGYLNITEYCSTHGISPDDCVRQMRQKVQTETGLTASAGIAPNKMLAKICSDKNKPNGQFSLPFERDAITAFMRELSIRKLPGVGRVHERLLDSIGVKTCGDIYSHRAIIWLMDHYFGKTFLYSAHLGIASNVVEPYQRDERKSIGAERTFNPINSHEKILEKLEEVAIELENDMRENGWAGKTVTLKYKLDTYQVYTRAKSFNRWITRKDDLFNTGKELLKPELPLCIRLIGLRVTKLKDLRAPADQGIKRFFQAGSTDRSEPSPKKRKIDDRSKDQLDEFQRLLEEEEETDLMADYPDAEQDGPWNFDEGLEAGENGELINTEKERSSSKPPSTVKPASQPRPNKTDASSELQTREDDPVDTSDIRDPDRDSPSTQPCPICMKELDARDNHALNEHIDFCLSKNVIKEASASASPGGSAARRSEKPKSRTGTRTLGEWDWRERQREGKGKGKR